VRRRPPALRAAGSGGGWGKAIEVPGLAALNKAGWAEVVSVSCWSAGNCAACGFYDGDFASYTALSGNGQAFVVSQKNGRWGKAIEVPGTASLNKGEAAQVYSVSCAQGGTCVAGGYDTDAGAHQHGFVASFRAGRWGLAVQLPGLSAGGGAQVYSVSCPSAGNCTAGGSNSGQGFVARQRDGRWQPAVAVPGLAALNVGGNAGVESVSCARPGDCAAGGQYQDSTSDNPLTGSPSLQAFVVSEESGRWGSAEEVPGTAPLNAAGFAGVTSVSCAPGGNCGAGGYDLPYAISALYGFVVSEKNGRWSPAERVTWDSYLVGELTSVSCPSAGNCAWVGDNSSGSPPGSQPPPVANGAWVVSENNGRRGAPEEVRGTLREGGAYSVSCWSAGNCVAGGYYAPVNTALQAFVVREIKGRWGSAEQVPGTAALNVGGGAEVLSVSCPSAGNCSAGGSYNDGKERTQAFVVSQAK
jgi:hypothetical protein